MSKVDVLKDTEFEEVTEVQLDSKNRVYLGILFSKFADHSKPLKERNKVDYYKVYINALGQIILDPQATIPASELWLFKNKHAARMVQEGLEDARKHRLVKPKEDYSQYLSDPE